MFQTLLLFNTFNTDKLVSLLSSIGLQTRKKTNCSCYLTSLLLSTLILTSFCVRFFVAAPSFLNGDYISSVLSLSLSHLEIFQTMINNSLLLNILSEQGTLFTSHVLIGKY
jgi:hypothetical protein